jgi:hypothetical protein
MWSGLGLRIQGISDGSLAPGRFSVIVPSGYKSHAMIESVILEERPEIFSIFGSKRFELLYRGSRDGFGSSVFHKRCNGKSGTVTIVQTAKGFIFGGYTPLAWRSPDRGQWAGDSSLQSFVFTVKNGRNLSPKRFGLKSDHSQYAILCYSGYGPCFGHDFQIKSDGNTGTVNHSSFGSTYTDDVGAGPTFLAGESPFTAKEVEVFQLRD